MTQAYGLRHSDLCNNAVANDQYLQTVDQMMVRALVIQRDKMVDDRP
ncbi:hypothetical protein CTATCC11996_14253 [Comamonas testosteroni ATCC 11996]|jgi:hypothetical protein|nr:hypothetical protein CTATCC11996_14253 [Comamonas testosteroni ATCC 11996]